MNAEHNSRAHLTLSSDTAVVHTQCDIGSVPSEPGPEWTRFVCISDTHCHSFPVPYGDVLLHSGDLTYTGTLNQFETTLNWLKSLPHPKKIIIAGNHDLSLDDHDNWYNENYQRWHRNGKQDVKAIRKHLLGVDAVESGLVYLQDEKYEFRSKEHGKLWSVYGSPWSPYFEGMGFNYLRSEADRIISAIPKVDILLTHGPPSGIFDKIINGQQVGCEALAARLHHLRPRLHVFGHIHEDHGATIHQWPSGKDDVNPHPIISIQPERSVYVNAANWPMGRKADLSSGERTPFGRGPFSPIIVDLKGMV